MKKPPCVWASVSVHCTTKWDATACIDKEYWRAEDVNLLIFRFQRGESGHSGIPLASRIPSPRLKVAVFRELIQSSCVYSQRLVHELHIEFVSAQLNLLKYGSLKMLVLSRRADQGVLIGSEIEIVVLEVQGQSAKLGILAPCKISIVRSELCDERNLDQKQQDQHEPAELTNCGGLIPSADERSDQLLHQFCERRKLWRMPEALQTLCVSALVAADSIVTFS